MTAPRQPMSARTKVIVGATAAVICGGGGFAIANQSSKPAHATDLSRVRCYSRLSTDFSVRFPGITVDGPHSGGHEPGLDPLGTCTAAWTRGLVAGSTTAPALTACVLPSGVIGVFPGGAGTCHTVGLPIAH